MKLFIIAIFLLSFNAQAVTFIGVLSEDQKNILKRYPTLSLQKPDYSILDLAISELSQTKNYELVKASIKNNLISIKAVPAKKIKSIEFVGNKAFSNSQLIKISKLKVLSLIHI